MEINFHYHVTYTAAVAAGFSTDDALVIARAAQYVDECEQITVQGNDVLFKGNILDTLSSSNDYIRRLLKIWPVFHFLPGDYTAIQASVNPNLRTSTVPRVRMAPPLICGTESLLTAAIVDEAKAYYQSSTGESGAQTQGLQRVGITMHVLADTFAHQTFAGIPLGCINEVRDVNHGKFCKELKRKWYFPFSYSPALTDSSFGYLGHGRIGHLPDMPGKFFTYAIEWNNSGWNTYIARYNPLEFYCAYLQMRDAMKHILSNSDPFPQRVDRRALLEEYKDERSEAHRLMDAFERSPTDKDLPGNWYQAVSSITQPQEYSGYDPMEERELYDSFVAAAEDHRETVLNHCQPLSRYMALFP